MYLSSSHVVALIPLSLSPLSLFHYHFSALLLHEILSIVPSQSRICYLALNVCFAPPEVIVLCRIRKKINMPVHARWNVPVDNSSFQQYLFGPPSSPLPDKVAFYDAERPETHFLTLEKFRLWSQRLAAGLQKAGLKPGDRVLLFSGNNLYFPVVFMGILMAGGIFTGANPGFVARELAYQLKDSEAKFLICADASLELGIEAADSVGIGKDRVFRFDDDLFKGTGTSRLGVENWASLMQTKEVGERFRWIEPADPKEAICCLNYSSGTTGVPKGVMITHYNYIANAIQFAYMSQLAPDEPQKTKRAYVKHCNNSLELTQTRKWLCFLPLYHAMAQTIFIAGGPKRGIPVYIMKKFDFIGLLENIQKFKITTLTLVPPIVVVRQRLDTVLRLSVS